MDKYIIVADGACSGNPGPGGWGLIVVTLDDQVMEFGGHEEQTTNNRMEMTGFYHGLQQVYRASGRGEKPGTIHVISDSKYVLDSAGKYVENWNRNGWKTSTGDDVKNKDLWEKILKGQRILREKGFRFEYELVKGHSGNEANERVDHIAVRFSKKEPVKLYLGTLQDFPVSLETQAPFQTVYLSLVNGSLKRHHDWSACQSEVTGKKGAKFKKVTNSLQEREILKEWGLKT